MHETILVAETYLKIGSWVEARKLVLNENLFKTRVQSTSKRIYREVELRLKGLKKDTLEILVTTVNKTVQIQILWVAVCKAYPFISSFAEEVLRDKVLALDYSLTLRDYDRFFNRQSQWHPELENISPSTAQKVKQVLFRLLKEVGFIEDNGEIIPVALSPQVIEIIKRENPHFMFVFPAPLQSDR